MENIYLYFIENINLTPLLLRKENVGFELLHYYVEIENVRMTEEV